MISSKIIKPSSITNITLLGIFLGSFFINKEPSSLLRTVSLYGLSGSLTNELAIKMIFEKIPYIPGSGIIEKNFESFKVKLRQTLIKHLFESGIELGSFNANLLAERLLHELANSEFSFFASMISQSMLVSLIEKVDLRKIINEHLTPESIDVFVEEKLNTLSPLTIRDLIYHVMEEHLDYLVVWGGFLGALIGLLAWLLGILA